MVTFKWLHKPESSLKSPNAQRWFYLMCNQRPTQKKISLLTLLLIYDIFDRLSDTVTENWLKAHISISLHQFGLDLMPWPKLLITAARCLKQFSDKNWKWLTSKIVIVYGASIKMGGTSLASIIMIVCFWRWKQEKLF